MQKLQGFLQLCLASPLTADKVDVRELLEQVWEAGEVGKESPVLDDETIKQRQAEQGGQIPPQIQDALTKQEALIQKLEDQLRDRTEKQALEAARLEIQDRDSRVNAEAKLAGVELTEAQRDQIQAQILTLVQAALGQVSPQLAQAAGTLEDQGTDTPPAVPPVQIPAPVATPDPAAAPVDQVTA